MNYLEAAQRFIDDCAKVRQLDDLKRELEGVTRAFGFRYFACLSHVDLSKPPKSAVVLHTYPREWIERHGRLRLDRVDPVFQHAARTLQPFFWTDEDFKRTLTPRQRDFMEEAQAAGLAGGFTVPIHSPGPHAASCTAVPADGEVHPHAYLAFYHMSVYAHESASRIVDRESARRWPAPQLTERERRCLEYVAQGKSDWAIGQILGLSQSTVHHHVERAKKRLGTATRVQAVVQALHYRQISFPDVIKGPDRKS